MHYEALVLSLVAASVTVVAVAVRRRVRPRRSSTTRVLRGRAARRAVQDCLQRPQPQPLLLVVEETAQIRRRPR